MPSASERWRRLASIGLWSYSDLRPSARRITTVLLCAAVFGWAFWFRVGHIAELFSLGGDQIDQWNIAQRPFWLLPKVGTPHTGLTGGGYSLGPIYYWVLWFFRVTICRIWGNLPHVAGCGLAAISSASSSFLLFALLRRNLPIALSFFAVLLLATSPYESSLSALIWNPNLAFSLNNFAIGCYLMTGPNRTVAQSALVAGLCWLGMQAHSSTLFLLAPLLLGLAFEAWRSGSWRGLVLHTAAAGLTIAVLQVPYIYFAYIHRGEMGSEVPEFFRVAKPSNWLRHMQLGVAYEYEVAATKQLLFEPYAGSFFRLLLPAMVLVVLWARTGIVFPTALTALTALACWLLRSIHTSYFDMYWMIPVLPSFALLFPALWEVRLVRVGVTANVVASACASAVILGACLVAIAMQPARLDRRWAWNVDAGYGNAVRVAMTLLRHDGVTAERRAATMLSWLRLQSAWLVHER